MADQVDLSIVVPVYQSACTLAELHRRVVQAVSPLTDRFELILVEDAGGDDSWAVMRSLRTRDHRVRIVELARNFGQHHALVCGFSFARGERVITMDDDLQHPPEEIPKLVAAMQATDRDVVFGVPLTRRHPWGRNLASRLFGRCVAAGSARHGGVRLSSFLIARRWVIESIVRQASPRPVVGLMLLEATGRVGEVGVAHHPRAVGRSRYSLARLWRLFLDSLLNHGNLAPRLMLGLGVASWLVGGGLAVAFAVRHETAMPVALPIVLALLFSTGAWLLGLSLVSEYLRRLLEQTGGARTYVIRNQDV